MLCGGLEPMQLCSALLSPRARGRQGRGMFSSTDGFDIRTYSCCYILCPLCDDAFSGTTCALEHRVRYRCSHYKALHCSHCSFKYMINEHMSIYIAAQEKSMPRNEKVTKIRNCFLARNYDYRGTTELGFLKMGD